VWRLVAREKGGEVEDVGLCFGSGVG
jgi:hypothetical protein